MGGVTSIPADFSISFAIAHAPSINAAVHAYGRLLTSSRPTALAPRSRPELHLLGYATDNGAYYYYQVVPLCCGFAAAALLPQFFAPGPRGRVQCHSCSRCQHNRHSLPLSPARQLALLQGYDCKPQSQYRMLLCNFLPLTLKLIALRLQAAQGARGCPLAAV
jgi:hypothetical protein